MRELIDLLEKSKPRMPRSNLVFVYGSLKHGFHNNHFLKNSRFLGTAKTPPRFDLINCGAFPAAIPGSNSLSGELFQVNSTVMRSLDELEGNGFLYQRKQ